MPLQQQALTLVRTMSPRSPPPPIPPPPPYPPPQPPHTPLNLTPHRFFLGYPSPPPPLCVPPSLWKSCKFFVQAHCDFSCCSLHLLVCAMRPDCEHELNHLCIERYSNDVMTALAHIIAVPLHNSHGSSACVEALACLYSVFCPFDMLYSFVSFRASDCPRPIKLSLTR